MAYSSEILGDMTTRFGKAIGYTHTGSWIADNILCGALCKVMNPDFQIYRRDELPESPAEMQKIFWDFDTPEESLNLYNWKVNAEYRSNDVRYGSFGLLWRDYGAYIILPWDKSESSRHVVEFMVDQFDEDIIEPLDVARENNTYHPWIDMIEMFNHIPNEKDLYASHEDEKVMFFKAIDYSRIFLERICEKYKMACNALVKIYESYDPTSDMNGIIFLDDEMEIDTDWALEFVREHMDGIYYMVRLSSVRGYNIFPVKKTYEQLEKEFPTKIDTPEKIGPAIYKMPLPSVWYGKRPEELNSVYRGLFYCQADSSMATCEDYDTAILICKNLIYSYMNSLEDDTTINDTV